MLGLADGAAAIDLDSAGAAVVLVGGADAVAQPLTTMVPATMVASTRERK